MPALFDAYTAIRDFMELGGPVLNAISATILVMWIMIIERVLFYRGELRVEQSTVRRRWGVFAQEIEGLEHRQQVWRAHLAREHLMAKFRYVANDGLPLIKTLVTVCPLLGLMGTVTGMIDVFGVLALSGTGNVRSMATGVSRATIPTMAGMVGALTGLLAITLLVRHASRSVEQLEESLTLDDM